MVGIGYCEFEGCRKRTSKSYCKRHKNPLNREEDRENIDEGHFLDAVIKRLRFYL